MDTTREFYECIPLSLPEVSPNKIVYLERSEARIAGFLDRIVRGMEKLVYRKQVRYTTLENLPEVIKFIEERNVVYKNFIWIEKNSPVREKPLSVYFYGTQIPESTVFKNKVESLF